MDFTFSGFLKWASGTLLACISFAGWVIAFVNTTMIHHDCGSNEECDNFFRRYWWSLMFQASIMVIVLFIWVSGSVHRLRTGIVGFLTLVTVQHIELVGNLMTALDDKTVDSWPERGANLNTDWLDKEELKGSIAGYMTLAFANMMYMIVFGIDGEKKDGRSTIPAESEKKEAPPQSTPPV